MEKAIIVADDSMIVKNIVEKAIDDEYMVLKASNGKEAIKHITDKKYEIIGMLLDLNMPESDGFMVLNYFKNNNLFKKYPIVIISGDDTKETIEKAFTYDIVDMLNKPFSKDNVNSMVNKIINFKS
ncbi:MAG: response regulator [Bacilli bacterium]|nr:response regulator [Bacilli bacterium]